MIQSTGLDYLGSLGPERYIEPLRKALMVRPVIEVKPTRDFFVDMCAALESNPNYVMAYAHNLACRNLTLYSYCPRLSKLKIHLEFFHAVKVISLIKLNLFPQNMLNYQKTDNIMK